MYFWDISTSNPSFKESNIQTFKVFAVLYHNYGGGGGGGGGKIKKKRTGGYLFILEIRVKSKI